MTVENVLLDDITAVFIKGDSEWTDVESVEQVAFRLSATGADKGNGKFSWKITTTDGAVLFVSPQMIEGVQR
jgi:hypothetical protein